METTFALWRKPLSVTVLGCTIAVLTASDAAPAFTADELLARIAKADRTRTAALTRYTAVRRYTLANERFKKRAEVMARIIYTHPGNKVFEILSESGSSVLRDRVLKRLIRTERELSQERDTARINATNYSIHLLGTESLNGRASYVIELVPKASSPYLVQGRAWVDVEDFAKVEGVLAKSPSMWTAAPRINHEYSKSGAFWLPAVYRSTADAPLFGRTDLVMECLDYRLEAGAVIPSKY